MNRALVFIEPTALRVPVQKHAAIVALMACLAYLVISRAAVETQRSFIMAAIVFGAIIFDRAAISLRTFAIALIAVVLLQPDSVVTPGFLMSFAATGALIAAFEIWRNKRSGKEVVLGPIAFSWISIAVTSLAAGLATMPFAIYHFDRATPIGFVANLAATPIVTFMSAPSAALALILVPLGLSDIGLRLFGYSLELLLLVSYFFAQFEREAQYAARAMPLAAVILATFALGAVIATKGIARFIFGGAFAAASLLAWSQAPRFVAHWSASGAFFYIESEQSVRRIDVTSGDGLAPLRYEDASLADCRAGTCETRGAAGEFIRIQTEGEPFVCILQEALATEDCNASSAVFWKWSNVTAAGGLTLYAKGDSFAVRLPSACGRRPWHPCQGRPS